MLYSCVVLDTIRMDVVGDSEEVEDNVEGALSFLMFVLILFHDLPN